MTSTSLLPQFLKTVISFLLILNSCTQGEKILFYWANSGYSHRISVWPLMEKLTERGHNVTFLSPYLPKVPDLNSKIIDFVPEGLLKASGIGKINFINTRLTKGIDGTLSLWKTYPELSVNSCKGLFQIFEVIQWLNRSSFDLVVVNAMFNDCGYALAYKFKAPVILYSSTSHFSWWTEEFGYPPENYPDFEAPFPVDKSFIQSLKTALNPLYWHFRRQMDFIPREDVIIRKALNMPDMPSLSELERNTSLIFVSNHFTEEFPRSLPPMFVQIGGIHCTDKRKPLPKDILEFIESSGDEGFIYLSFGSYATLSMLPQNIQDIFFKVMKKFEQKFLIKHDGDGSKKFPENVKPVRWISQQDVLAHSKIRALIGHGGLLGTQESLYHGVPMIVFPFFAEQDYNSMLIQARQTGITLELSQLTEQILEDAIKEILTNEKYRKNAKKISELYKDRPFKPVDTAVWWVEYILRNRNDTSHLRPIGIKRNWYQRRQLDIWGFIALTIFIILTILTFTIYYLIKSLKSLIFCKHSLSNSNVLTDKNSKKFL